MTSTYEVTGLTEALHTETRINKSTSSCQTGGLKAVQRGSNERQCQEP